MHFSGFQDDFGIERTDVENWIHRIGLRTHYDDTMLGRAREFSRLNVFELAVVKSLVSNGCRPFRAVAYAEFLLDAFRYGHELNWLILPAPDFLRLKWKRYLTRSCFGTLKKIPHSHGCRN